MVSDDFVCCATLNDTATGAEDLFHQDSEPVITWMRAQFELVVSLRNAASFVENHTSTRRPVDFWKYSGLCSPVDPDDFGNHNLDIERSTHIKLNWWLAQNISTLMASLRLTEG